jgi:hypothetical protein
MGAKSRGGDNAKKIAHNRDTLFYFPYISIFCFCAFETGDRGPMEINILLWKYRDDND